MTIEQDVNYSYLNKIYGNNSISCAVGGMELCF